MEATLERSQGTASVRLDSRFDMSVIAGFRDAYGVLLADEGVREIVVDFSRTSFMDSSALGMLLLLREQAGAAGKKVCLASCSGSVLHIITVAQFNRLFAMR